MDIGPWQNLNTSKPLPSRDLWLLWTHPLERGRVEQGSLGYRKGGREVLNYTYCGSIEPTHFCYMPDLPPYPDIGTAEIGT
jgi:hypothetical protein